MNTTDLYDMAADASICLQIAKARLTELHKRYGMGLEDIAFTPIIGNEASDFEEAVRMGIDLLSNLTGMAEKVMSDIDSEGGPLAVERAGAQEAAAEARLS